jgi:hypothetical protein
MKNKDEAIEVETTPLAENSSKLLKDSANNLLNFFFIH